MRPVHPGAVLAAALLLLLPAIGTLAPAQAALPRAVGPDASDPADAAHAADPAIPSLAWAPLRTGYRFAVAWTTEDPVLGTLHYRVDGGPEQEVSESLGGTAHLLVLDDLPPGGTLAFRVSYEDGGTTVESDTHVVTLSNAHRGRDAQGKYTLNMLVVANERLLERDILIEALDRAAPQFYDATDGHIRFGKVLLVFGDLENPDLGFACHVAFLVPPTYPCTRMADAVFTADLCPGASACVVGGTLDNPDAAIIMNDLPFGGQANLIGETYVHELGHYAFDQQDLYGWGAGCVDAAFDISIMDDAARSEFDDEFARCPNEDDVPDYVPTWTVMQERYTTLPDRPQGPDPGPVGQDGGAYELVVLEFL